MGKLTDADLLHYARLGAERELMRILDAFPDLLPQPTPDPPAQVMRVSRRKRRMSKAQRQAVSERMRALWTGRRKRIKSAA